MARSGYHKYPPDLQKLADKIRSRSNLVRMAKLDLPDFETDWECQINQNHMLSRFMRYLPPLDEVHHLQRCSLGRCEMKPCVEGCWFGTYNRRVDAMTTGYPILKAHPGPKLAVTIVHPLWEAPVGKLSTINIQAAAQWNSRRLAQLKIPDLLVIGGFEVSLNRELNGEMHWAGEIQQVVCGATKEQLLEAFSIQKKYRNLRRNQHMLDVRGFASLPRKFAYGQKRLVTMRKAKISNKTGNQIRFSDPPYAKHWTEHDAWMLNLALGDRIILFGCSRRGTIFFRN